MRITEYSYDGVNWQRISDEVGSLRAFIMGNPRATIRSRDVPDERSQSTYVEGREAPRRAGRAMQLPTPSAYGDDGEMAEPVEVVSEPAPDIEACARAGYMARFDQQLFPWDGASPACRDAWREVARAVLAAAKGAGR